MTPSLFLYLEPSLQSQIHDLNVIVWFMFIGLALCILFLAAFAGELLRGKADKPKDSKGPKS